MSDAGVAISGGVVDNEQSLPDRSNAQDVHRAPHGTRYVLASGLLCQFASERPVAPRFGVTRSAQLLLKRLCDIVLSLGAIAALLPFLVLVSIAIKVTSPGPVFFTQQRWGHRGRIIRVFKFRTMYRDQCDASGVAQTQLQDPRVTPIGRIMRRLNIDELPQLLNVLRGDMSLVGPRPHPIGMLAAGRPYEETVPYYFDRHWMKPGLTGWAQANGFRGRTDEENKAIGRVHHDLAYIQNFSLWLDAIIIGETLKRELLRGSGD